MKLAIFLIGICCLLSFQSRSQTVSIDSLQNKFSIEKLISFSSNRLKKFNDKLARRSEKTIEKFHKTELKLYKKLKDSTLSKEKIDESNAKYEALLQNKNKVPSDKFDGNYNPYIDSLQTLVKLAQNSSIPTATLEEAKKKLRDAKANLQYSEKLNNYLKERRELLTKTFSNMKMFKEFKKLNKNIYYYNAYVSEYKSVLNDRKKIEKKAMEFLMKNKAVKNFFAKNSVLGSLFRTPDNEIPSGVAANLPGIQTRESINDYISQRVSSGGPSAATQIQSQLQMGKAELSALKDKLYKYGSTSEQIPDFKPNSQKTKSFKKRLVPGGNIQFSKGAKSFPALTDLGLSLGYKLNDKSTVGVGVAYKFGLGKGWDAIKFSTEGHGIRSYIDWKIKGNFYVAGGFEINTFKNLPVHVTPATDPKPVTENAGLIGITKKYNAGGKMKGNIQLLYNFLNTRNLYKQPIIFRIGYTFK